METTINAVAWLLSLVPLILLFYLPALFGVATWKERGDSYRPKAILWLAIGCGGILALQLLFTSNSALQVLGVFALSLVQLSCALALALFTVYKLAD
jgi:hypothetical protein